MTLDGARCIHSLVGHALYLRQDRFLRESFTQAGWTKEQVEEIFEEEMYLGIPHLLDGRLQYLSQEQCWREFLLCLIEGKLDDLLPHEVALHVGTCKYEIQRLMKEVRQAIALKSTPGGWDDHNEICLDPGVDFGPYIEDFQTYAQIDIRDW